MATEHEVESATDTLRFPTGFRWGVATAAHQYEGGNTNNQWFAWEQQGHIANGDHSGLACDWWEHAERDFEYAQHMGLNALRLSLEWSRIEPRPGEWSGAAIARYRQMLLGLRERGIEPMVTLHHFTNPLWLEERGAFLAADVAERFECYAAHVVRELGDLCDFWCTINEPNVYSAFGYQTGTFPPGRRGDVVAAVRVQAAMARAHAAAYRVIHAAQPNARVGWAHHYYTFEPAHPISLLERLIVGLQDAAFNDLFPRMLRTGAAAFPFSLFAGDLGGVRSTCDFMGINTYYRDRVTFDPRVVGELFGRRFTPSHAPRGDYSAELGYGESYPRGILGIARCIAPLGIPMYVTENGIADASDHLRPWLIATAARAMHDAIAEGIDLRGYYHWSLVDNFEWAEGWRMRFGLIELDAATQQRTMRPSGELYSAIAHANALTPAMLAAYAPDVLAEIFPVAKQR